MVRFARPLGFVAALSIAGLVAASTSGSTAEASARCRPVRGITHALFTSTNCTSPVGLCTSGQLHGGGTLDGATVFLAFDAVPAAGMPTVEPAANLVYSGQFTITSRFGTLVTNDLGVLDASGLSFSELERPVSGTGIFKNPSHDFFVTGAITDDGNGFTGELSGVLCTDGVFDW